MTNYMPIVPIGYLEALDVAETKNVFILSQYWKIPEYRDYYLERKWDTIVLDNALYEDSKATNFESMMNMARQLRAQKIFIVGPEKLDDGIETGRMTIDILEEYQSEGHLTDEIDLMCILHERPNEMLQQWNMIRKYRDVALGISIFSYRLGFDRGSLYRFLDLPGDRYVHAFGWDNLLEMYNCYDLFDSVDSSLCVSAAINGINLKKYWQITRKPKKDGFICAPRVPISDKVKPGDDTMYEVVKNIRFLDTFAYCPTTFKESDLPC